MELKDIKPFVQGENILICEQREKMFGMTFAWGMLYEYGKIMILCGEQSDTNSLIREDDVISISALAKGQEKIGLLFGENHSKTFDKFADKKIFSIFKGYKVIKDAAIHSICKIERIVKINNETNDKLLLCDVLEYKRNNKGIMIYEEK